MNIRVRKFFSSYIFFLKMWITKKIKLYFYEEKLIQTFKKCLLKSIPNKNSKTE